MALFCLHATKSDFSHKYNAKVMKLIPLKMVHTRDIKDICLDKQKFSAYNRKYFLTHHF